MDVLIIGTGFGVYAMAPAYERLGFTVRTVSPREDAEVAQAIAAGADLVSVHSPPFMHQAHVMAALDRGLPVLCDKPFGANAGEARAMRDRAAQLGLPNFINFEMRWHPARAMVRQLLAEGAIGNLAHVHWSMFGNGLRRRRFGWLFETERAGGWIGAYGAHVLDAMCWWTGSDIAQSGGMGRTEIGSRPDGEGAEKACTAEDAFTIWAAMESGATLGFDSGFCASINVPERVLLMGSEGALELIGDRELWLRRPDGTSEPVALPDLGADPYAVPLNAMLTEVVKALRGEPSLALGFAEGADVTEAIDALRSKLVRL